MNKKYGIALIALASLSLIASKPSQNKKQRATNPPALHDVSNKIITPVDEHTQTTPERKLHNSDSVLPTTTVEQDLTEDGKGVIATTMTTQPSVNGDTIVTTTDVWTYYDYAKVAATIALALALGTTAWYNKDALAQPFTHGSNYFKSWLTGNSQNKSNVKAGSDERADLKQESNQSTKELNQLSQKIQTSSKRILEVIEDELEHNKILIGPKNGRPSLPYDKLDEYREKMIEAWKEKFGINNGTPFQIVSRDINPMLHETQVDWLNDYLRDPNNFEGQKLSLPDRDAIKATDAMINSQRFYDAFWPTFIGFLGAGVKVGSINPVVFEASMGLVGAIPAATAAFLYSNANPKTAQESMDTTDEHIEKFQLYQ